MADIRNLTPVLYIEVYLLTRDGFIFCVVHRTFSLFNALL